MRPMTLVERGRGDGTVSLERLFVGEEPVTDLDPGGGLQEALDDLVHGGWPADIPLTTQQAQHHLRDYVNDVISIDVGRLDGEPRRDPVRMAALLRSRYAVRTSPKLHLVDPALAEALTGASTARLMQDLQTAGQWFESQAVMHLRVFAEALGGQVYHYRDKSGREADAVVELPDERWGLVEVTLGQRRVPAARDSIAVICWSANLQPQVKSTFKMGALIGRGSGESFQLGFHGPGFVVVQPSEGLPVVASS
ncbi:DUF4143 domain-containing protein [Actinomyces trachealis]|uniref:DUF4143 domain-containing protein n=1 Tax=Actinomyces trachealis TaxID=2763540 RepID=UPI001F3FC9CC|nr:DUF4143 domain-containing protein [Actinomyces trachealis]